MHPIRIGTCGWSYKDWSGVFYPDDVSEREFLSSYAERFPIVEADSTFYRTPSRKMVAGWRERTPDHFGFSLKVPQVITHEKVLRDCGAEVRAFLDAVRFLEQKLLCCVLQFGYMSNKVVPGLKGFLERLEPFLAAWPQDVPLAVEVRNRTWMTQPLADCLRAHRVAWVLSDQAWMPSPLSLVEKLDTVTGPLGYVRLLGERAAVDARTATLNEIVVDRTEQLQADARAIRTLAGRVPVLAFVNNHFAGYAPETARQLRELLGGDGGASVPDSPQPG